MQLLMVLCAGDTAFLQLFNLMNIIQIAFVANYYVIYLIVTSLSSKFVFLILTQDA